MHRFDRRLINALALAAGIPLVGACSSDSLSSIKIAPTNLQRPDWLSYSGNKEEFTLRPVGPADLVGPEGQCAAAANVPAPDPSAEPGAPALVQGGIALQMTECDVVRRAGAPERVEFGTNQRGERTVVLTYIRGARPGIYRFAEGRLVSIERAPEPPAPAKKAPAKRRG
jgi:hypothetical protein